MASPFGCRSGHIPLSRKPPCPGTGRLARASALLLMHAQRNTTMRDCQPTRRMSSTMPRPKGQCVCAASSVGTQRCMPPEQEPCPGREVTAAFGRTASKSKYLAQSDKSLLPQDDPRRRSAHDERGALHSITSSARASSVGGTVRPSALAVFRLMISLNLVARSTGRSAGLVPLRILSTKWAKRR